MYFRTIWISDIHLGGKNIQSEDLVRFLEQTESDYLYLVGDIFDFWQLKRKWHWPKINNKILSLVFEKAKNGTKVVYIPGNHDSILKQFSDTSFHNITIQEKCIHQSIDGTKYLITHGDQFDSCYAKSPWISKLGSFAYENLLVINRWYNRFRSFCGQDYFSISAYLKNRSKKIVHHISNFENVVVRTIKDQEVDGIICGHIHQASIRNIGSYLYSNTGDWVESGTALAENHNGTLGIIQWVEHQPNFTTEKPHEKDPYSDGCLAPTN